MNDSFEDFEFFRNGYKVEKVSRNRNSGGLSYFTESLVFHGDQELTKI